jgi:hypothetical protein
VALLTSAPAASSDRTFPASPWADAAISISGVGEAAAGLGIDIVFGTRWSRKRIKKVGEEVEGGRKSGRCWCSARAREEEKIGG